MSRRIAHAATPGGARGTDRRAARPRRAALSARQVWRSSARSATGPWPRSWAVAQRVPSKPSGAETLYNTNDPTTGKATAGSFGGKSSTR